MELLGTSCWEVNKPVGSCSMQRHTSYRHWLTSQRSTAALPPLKGIMQALGMQAVFSNISARSEVGGSAGSREMVDIAAADRRFLGCFKLQAIPLKRSLLVFVAMESNEC